MYPVKVSEMQNNSIGIFDSGVGGLTVVKAVQELMPNEKIIYFGDTAHVPYGTKSNEVIHRLTSLNIDFLKSKNVKLLICACNSMSAVALPELAKEHEIPVLGVVEAGVKAALLANKSRIGVIGTPATINSCAYQNLLLAENDSLDIWTTSCPLFVPLVEEACLDDQISFLVAQKYLAQAKGTLDSLILGCTHYPLLKQTIAKVLPNVELIDSAQVVAAQAKELLASKAALSQSKGGSLNCYLSDDAPNFTAMAKMILGRTIQPKICKIN